MEFLVEIDFTMSKQIVVKDAENEEQAKAKAEEMIKKDPQMWASSGAYVGHKVTDVFNCG